MRRFVRQTTYTVHFAGSTRRQVMTAAEVEAAIKAREISDTDKLSLPDGRVKAFWEFPRFARYKPIVEETAPDRSGGPAQTGPQTAPSTSQRRALDSPRSISAQHAAHGGGLNQSASPTGHGVTEAPDDSSMKAAPSDFKNRETGEHFPSPDAASSGHNAAIDGAAPPDALHPTDDAREGREEGAGLEPPSHGGFDTENRLASLRQIRRRLKSDPKGHSTVEKHLEQHLRARRRSRSNQASANQRAVTPEEEAHSDFDFSPTQIALGAEMLLDRLLNGPIEDVLGAGATAGRAELSRAYKKRVHLVEDRFESSARLGDRDAAEDLKHLFEQTFRTLTTPALARDIERRIAEAKKQEEAIPTARVLLSFMRKSAARALVQARREDTLSNIKGVEKLAHDDIMEKILEEDRQEKEALRARRESARQKGKSKGLAGVFGSRKSSARSDSAERRPTTGARAVSETSGATDDSEAKRQKVLLAVLGVVLLIAIALQFI